MFCNKCGNNLPDGSVFCNKCGNQLNSSNPSPSQSVNPVKAEYSESAYLPSKPEGYFLTQMSWWVAQKLTPKFAKWWSQSAKRILRLAAIFAELALLMGMVSCDDTTYTGVDIITRAVTLRFSAVSQWGQAGVLICALIVALIVIWTFIRVNKLWDKALFCAFISFAAMLVMLGYYLISSTYILLLGSWILTLLYALLFLVAMLSKSASLYEPFEGAWFDKSKETLKQQLPYLGVAAVVVIVLAVQIISPILLSERLVIGNANKITLRINYFTTTDGSTDKELNPKDLTALSLYNPSNADLAVLKHCNNLKYLELNWSDEKPPAKLDLAPLKNLKLECLAISGASGTMGSGKTNRWDIKSLEPLKNMESLVVLYLSDCKITDISALSGLKNLSFLYISDENDIKIKDYTPLYNLTNLGTYSTKFEEICWWEDAPHFIAKNPRFGVERISNTVYWLWITNGNAEEHNTEIHEKFSHLNYSSIVMEAFIW